MKRIWIAIGLAVLLVLMGAAAVTAGQRHPEPVRGTVHIVQPGESLWGIAATAYPREDPREKIRSIEEVNHLGSSEVLAGQRLIIPLR